VFCVQEGDIAFRFEWIDKKHMQWSHCTMMGVLQMKTTLQIMAKKLPNAPFFAWIRNVSSFCRYVTYAGLVVHAEYPTHVSQQHLPRLVSLARPGSGIVIKLRGDWLPSVDSGVWTPSEEIGVRISFNTQHKHLEFTLGKKPANDILHQVAFVPIGTIVEYDLLSGTLMVRC
jgi:hypothetical protein